MRFQGLVKRTQAVPQVGCTLTPMLERSLTRAWLESCTKMLAPAFLRPTFFVQLGFLRPAPLNPQIAHHPRDALTPVQ